LSTSVAVVPAVRSNLFWIALDFNQKHFKKGFLLPSGLGQNPFEFQKRLGSIGALKSNVFSRLLKIEILCFFIKIML